jgi:lipopolysaccharide transport system ATP-binding protein
MRALREPAIDVRGIGKRYSLGGALTERTLKDALGLVLANLAMPLRQTRRFHSRAKNEFWALRDVSFRVGSGEVVGIVGNNGAGKSTLLKIMSRITEPTTGEASYSGRVGSLLEVGTGFHSELSGRDNIFLSGAILGMRRRDIALRFDEIVAFAGVEAFIDLPVKRYSSGMYLRLAFAVCAHLDTEILLVDEVLAVGDVSFQKKCLARMDEVANDGRTVLFVSHNLTAIKALCKRTLVLEAGRLIADSETGEALAMYLKSSTAADGITTMQRWSEECAPASEAVRMISASVCPIGGTPFDPIYVASGLSIACCYRNPKAGSVLKLNLMLQNEQGLVLFNTGAWDPPAPLAVGIYRSCCLIPGNLLNDGGYWASLTFRDQQDEAVLRLPRILHFQILDSEDGRHGWFGKWDGILRPHFSWNTETVNAVDARDPLAILGMPIESPSLRS